MPFHLGIDGFVAQGLWLTELIVFFLSIFWRPTLGIYLLVLLLPLQTIRYRLHGYFLGGQFIDVLLLGVLLGLKRQGRPILPKTPLNVLLGIYVIFTYLSMVHGSFFLGVELPLWFSDARVSMWKNYVVDIVLIFFLTVSAIRTKRQMVILLMVMSIGVMLVAKGFRNVMSGRDATSFSYQMRDAGPMAGAGPNGLAAFGAQMSAFFLGVFLAERRFLPKVGYLGTIAAATYCVIWAFSRGGYAAFLVSILYLGLARSRMLLVGLALFIVGWQGVVPSAVQDRILMTTDDRGNLENSAASRVTLWEEAMRVFEADPVFGTGFATYSFGSHVGGFGDTHNLFVKVLVETGIVGLLLFLAIFAKLFMIGFQLFRSATDPFLKSIGLGFSALMVSAFVANMFGDRWMYYQITGYTYAFAALAVRGQNIVNETPTELEETTVDDEGGVFAPVS
jgi:O-antigen ligase